MDPVVYLRAHPRPNTDLFISDKYIEWVRRFESTILMSPVSTSRSDRYQAIVSRMVYSLFSVTRVIRREQIRAMNEQCTANIDRKMLDKVARIGDDMVLVELVELGIFGRRESPILPIALTKILAGYLSYDDIIIMMSGTNGTIWNTIRHIE